MRKNLPVFKTLFTAAALLSLMTTSSFAAQITQENAKSIALTHAGIEEEDTAYLRVESDKEDGRQIYDVKFFTKAYAEYNYEILADSGKIINIEYDAEAVLSQSKLSDRTAVIGLEKAKEIAASHTGRKKDDVTFTKAKTDYDDGRQVYEIEFFTDELEKYEFEISAKTGIIDSWEYDAEEKDIPAELRDKKTSSKQTASASTEASAEESLDSVKAAVLKKAGLKESEVTWGRIHSDYDDGRLIYEGKFFQGRLEYEFEVDAKTLAVIDWDIERIDD